MGVLLLNWVSFSSILHVLQIQPPTPFLGDFRGPPALSFLSLSLSPTLFVSISFLLVLVSLSPQKDSHSFFAHPYNREISTKSYLVFPFHAHSSFCVYVWVLASLLIRGRALHPIGSVCMITLNVHPNYVKKIYGNRNEEERRTSFSFVSTFPLSHLNSCLKG